MSKRKPSSKPHRRPGAEIARNYFFADVLIKTGAAVAAAVSTGSLRVSPRSLAAFSKAFIKRLI